MIVASSVDGDDGIVGGDGCHAASHRVASSLGITELIVERHPARQFPLVDLQALDSARHVRYQRHHQVDQYQTDVLPTLRQLDYNHAWALQIVADLGVLTH